MPTIAESGYKDFEIEVWYGLFAPAKTPNERLAQLTGRFTEAQLLLIGREIFERPVGMRERGKGRART